MATRIYQVNIEHRRWGLNYSSVRVDARTAEEAIRKAKKDMGAGERVESIELLAHTDS